MLALAMALAASVPAEGQVLAGEAFEDLAAQTDAICRLRHVRLITPGDLDYIQEDFEEHLSPRMRGRLRSANTADRRCQGRNGLACPTTGTLEAFERVGLMAKFTAYICSHPAPRTKGTVSGNDRARPSVRP